MSEAENQNNGNENEGSEQATPPKDELVQTIHTVTIKNTMNTYFVLRITTSKSHNL